MLGAHHRSSGDEHERVFVAMFSRFGGLLVVKRWRGIGTAPAWGENASAKERGYKSRRGTTCRSFADPTAPETEQEHGRVAHALLGGFCGGDNPRSVTASAGKEQDRAGEQKESARLRHGVKLECKILGELLYQRRAIIDGVIASGGEAGLVH